jgi:outer membrane protein OmpA-like peptidoglycan-associated protein
MRSLSFQSFDLRVILGASAVSLALGACGGSSSAATTPQLVDARRAYQDAQASNASTLAPDALIRARQALTMAEKAHKGAPGSNEEAHLAYMAERQAQIATAEGRTAASQDAERQAIHEYQAKLENSAKAREGELAQAQTELEAAERARQEAEASAAAALSRLQEIATVKEGLRGTVITLSGSVLFPTGSDTLSDTARERLHSVAEALEAQPEGTQIRIEGYTDATGTEAANEQLSERRAQAVRDYLTAQGVAADQLDAIGRGESSPVATNDTPDGRANNRRVEIVIEPRKGEAPKEGGNVPNKPAAPSSSAKTPPQP